MVASDLAQEILTRRENHHRSLSKLSRQVNPRASGITSCDREMYYSITAWDKKPLFEPWLIARFEEGKEQERKVIRELIDLGFEVVEGQKPFVLKDRNGRVVLTGSIDGTCLWKGKKTPFEVKSLDPNIYSQINTVEDFNRYDWAKRYPRQMQCYLFGNNYEEGLFIITDCKGHWKVFVVTLDLNEMEKIFQRCEDVMDAVETGIAPLFCKDSSICRKCWARGRVCEPSVDFGPGAEIVDDVEVEAKLIRRQELLAASKEYEQIDKEVKGYFRDRPAAICGDFSIIGKERIINKKAAEAHTVKQWIVKIEKVEAIK